MTHGEEAAPVRWACRSLDQMLSFSIILLPGKVPMGGKAAGDGGETHQRLMDFIGGDLPRLKPGRKVLRKIKSAR